MFVLSSLSFLLSLIGVAVDNSRSINEEYKDLIMCIINFHIDEVFSSRYVEVLIMCTIIK